METICGATFVFDHDGEPDLIGNELTGAALPSGGKPRYCASQTALRPTFRRGGVSLVLARSLPSARGTGPRLAPSDVRA